MPRTSGRSRLRLKTGRTFSANNSMNCSRVTSRWFVMMGMGISLILIRRPVAPVRVFAAPLLLPSMVCPLGAGHPGLVGSDALHEPVENHGHENDKARAGVTSNQAADGNTDEKEIVHIRIRV